MRSARDGCTHAAAAAAVVKDATAWRPHISCDCTLNSSAVQFMRRPRSAVARLLYALVCLFVSLSLSLSVPCVSVCPPVYLYRDGQDAVWRDARQIESSIWRHIVPQLSTATTQNWFCAYCSRTDCNTRRNGETWNARGVMISLLT